MYRKGGNKGEKSKKKGKMIHPSLPPYTQRSKRRKGRIKGWRANGDMRKGRERIKEG